jgi:hypothetical protein
VATEPYQWFYTPFKILKILLTVTSVEEATFSSISYISVQELSYNKILYSQTSE